MGNTLAQNIVNDSVNVLVQVVNQTTQNCEIQGIQSQVIQVCGNVGTGSGSTLNAGGTQTEVFNVSIACAQDAQFQNTISQSLQEQVTQLAKSISQSLDFNPGSTESNNVLNLTTNLATVIQNTYVQNCIANPVQQQGYGVCNNTNFGNIIVSPTQGEFFTGTLNCVQTSAAVNNVKQTFIQQISQTAEATVESFLGPLLFILIICLLIFCVFTFGGAKAFLNWKFLLLIVVLIAIFIAIAAWRGWWPFKRRNTNPPAPTNN